MPDLDTILTRLRDPEGPLKDLVTLAVDRGLERPLAEVLPPAETAARLAEALKAIAADDALEQHLGERIRATLGKDPPEGRLRDQLPKDAVAPLRRLASRPYTPDPELVRAVIDHPAMRKVMREVLQDTLLQFAKKLSAVSKGLPGGKRLSGLMDVAKGVASVVGGEVERQLEGKVSGFLEEGIGRVVELSVRQLTAEDRAREMAKWRADLVDVALDQPMRRYHAELKKSDPAGAMEDARALVTAWAEWDALEARATDALKAVLARAGGESLGEALGGTGVVDGLRPGIEAGLLDWALDVVGTEAFEAWFGALLAD